MKVMRHTDVELTMVDYNDQDRLDMAAAIVPEINATPTATADKQAATDTERDIQNDTQPPGGLSSVGISWQRLTQTGGKLGY